MTHASGKSGSLHVGLWSTLWLVLLLGASWALRLPYYEREIWNLDEGATFTMAEQILHGDVMYRDAVDHRSPLVPYLKAAVFGVAGDWNVRAQHIAMALALGFCAFGLLALCTGLGERKAGFGSALIFTVLILLLPGASESLAIHTESFVILFSTIGFWLFVRALNVGSLRAGLLVGFAFAASTLCKQPGLLDFGVTWVLLAFLAWREPDKRARHLRLFLGALIGFGFIFGLACLYFWAHGVWRDFVYYVWTYNTRFYVPEVPFGQRLSMVHMTWDLTLVNAPFLLIVAIPGVALALFQVLPGLVRPKRTLPLLPLLALGWLATGVISTTLSGRPFAHYVIQVVPGLSLVSGLMLARASDWLLATNNRRLVSGWIGCALVFWIGHEILKFRQGVISRDEPSKIPLRTLVQRYTTDRDRIFIWGYFPDGYVISQRLPATRFLYTNFLTGLIPWTNAAADKDTRYAIVPGSWDAFWHDFEAARPRVIINAPIRSYLKYPMMSQPRLRDEIIDHYAELQPSDFELNDGKVFYRLSALGPTLLTATPKVDESISIKVARDSNQIDLVVATVSAPAGTTALTLRLGGRPYRLLEPKPDAPVEARFFIRIADLAARDAGNIDVVAVRNNELLASTNLDIIKQLVLNIHPVEPAPVLVHGIRSIHPQSVANPDEWKPEIIGEHAGWRHTGPFSLSFERPVGMEILRFGWKSEDETPGLIPEVMIESVDGSSALLTVSSRRKDGIAFIGAHLHADTKRIMLRWTSPGATWLGEIAGEADGPALCFGEQTIAPTLSESADHRPFVSTSPATNSVPVPFRILYPRVPGVEGVTVSFGLSTENSGSLSNPGRATFQVGYLHEDGHLEYLYVRHLDPEKNPADRGMQSARINLPSQGAGEIEIRFIPRDPGPKPSNAFFSKPRAMGPGPDLIISPDRVLVPSESQAFGGDRVHLHDDDGWLAHAPSRVVFPCPADLHAITFGFHLPPRAYHDEKGNRRSDGIGAIVEFVDLSGATTTLYRRTIDPHSEPLDRGVIKARVELPGRPGQLVIRLTPGPYTDNAFDWSYLTEIVGEADPVKK